MERVGDEAGFVLSSPITPVDDNETPPPAVASSKIEAGGPPPSGFILNWSNSLLALAFALLGCVAVFRIYDYDPAPAELPPGHPVSAGIRGFLAALALITALRPFLLFENNRALLWVFDQALWAQRTTPGLETYDPLWAPLSLFALAGSLFFFVFSVLLLVLLCKKRSSLPRLAILFHALYIAFRAVDLLLVLRFPPLSEHSTPVLIVGLVIHLLVGGFWIAYLLQPGRVKATFTRRRFPDAKPAPEPQSGPGPQTNPGPQTGLRVELEPGQPPAA